MGKLWARYWVLCAGPALMVACSVPLVEGLSERSATDIVVALSRNDIGATKERDPSSEGRFRVSVSSQDVALALTTLEGEGLPARSAPGVLESLGENSLVPSRTSERARFLVGTAGELEQSLRQVSGVLSARVHLAVPERDPLSDATEQAASASVLLRHSGATPPVSPEEVKRLVAGAVNGLQPEGVAVVLSPVPTRSAEGESRLAQLGPLTVARSSVATLRLVLISAVGLNLLLLLAALGLWNRLRAAHREIGVQRSATPES